ncbi:MAG: hypothetical protein CM15mP32_6040 [Flavobacteriaceae bacterium]|nr:MAG: hypothetical protein CM15mP32_6040 [Flavobacteriaceae bacterium]
MNLALMEAENYSNTTTNEILEAYFNYQTDLSLFDVEITRLLIPSI